MGLRAAQAEVPYEVPSASVPSLCLSYALQREETVAENTFLKRDGNVGGEKKDGS